MPGINDPASVALPQQPIHLALFDKAKAFVPSTLESVTNPCWWDIDGVKVFGSSGQNIDDVYRYVDDAHIESGRIGLLEKMLRWRHCAPTAPDTLCTLTLKLKLTSGCYPFQDRDPFVLEETPHIFFAGNQPEYASRLVQGINLVIQTNDRRRRTKG
jgi:DNA polymerase delta subunit 2